MQPITELNIQEYPVRIAAGGVQLAGDVSIPTEPGGIVLFAHGSGSGRHSSRNRFVASELNQSHLATLLFDLLTEEEEHAERYSRHLRFDIDMLANRLVAATDWITGAPEVSALPIGYFGASTGAAAALVAAALRPEPVRAVVSRGGRPDLAGDALPRVQAPTLLIVGSRDDVVIELNQQALAQLNCEKRLDIVPGATHLFEEPGTLEEVSRLARGWFSEHLLPEPPSPDEI